MVCLFFDYSPDRHHREIISFFHFHCANPSPNAKCIYYSLLFSFGAFLLMRRDITFRIDEHICIRYERIMFPNQNDFLSLAVPSSLEKIRRVFPSKRRSERRGKKTHRMYSNRFAYFHRRKDFNWKSEKNKIEIMECFNKNCALVTKMWKKIYIRRKKTWK